MGKLHELLAREADAEKIFKHVIQQMASLFSKRADSFMGFERGP